MQSNNENGKRAMESLPEEINSISIPGIQIDGQIGSGTFGTVFKGKYTKTGERLALKRIKIDAEKESHGFPITGNS